MPFRPKNVGATYQRLVNKMFVDLIQKIIKVYVGEMIVKSLKLDDHVTHLNETFQILRRYRIKLNPSNARLVFLQTYILGYMVNQKGIEVNLEKIQALVKIRSPKKPKEVQSFNKSSGRSKSLHFEGHRVMRPFSSKS